MEFLFYFWSLLLCAAHAAHQSLNNEIYLPQICSQKEIRKEMERKKNGEKENETKNYWHTEKKSVLEKINERKANTNCKEKKMATLLTEIVETKKLFLFTFVLKLAF